MRGVQAPPADPLQTWATEPRDGGLYQPGLVFDMELVDVK